MQQPTSQNWSHSRWNRQLAQTEMDRRIILGVLKSNPKPVPMFVFSINKNEIEIEIYLYFQFH